jgi:hypothetical protein
MMVFATQVAGLLFLAFLAGCVAGCWLRRSFGRQPG